jgi:hypothetical protein
MHQPQATSTSISAAQLLGDMKISTLNTDTSKTTLLSRLVSHPTAERSNESRERSCPQHFFIVAITYSMLELIWKLLCDEWTSAMRRTIPQGSERFDTSYSHGDVNSQPYYA